MGVDVSHPGRTDAPPAARHRDLLVDQGVIGWTAPGPPSPEAGAFRRALGLPDDRAIVMTGHQPAFWHAGILAKYLAADALAQRETDAGRPAVAVWCVPDHQSGEPGRVAYPAESAGGPGRWARRETDLFAEGGVPDDLPASLAGVRTRLAAATGSSPAERQIAAHRAVLEGRLGLSSPAPTVLATRKHATDAFGGVLDAMARDPIACVRAYNDAAAANPDAGVRPLALDEQDPENTELPLWAVSDRGTLVGVRAGDLGNGAGGDAGRTARDRIRPRALLFTGLLRALGCDLFIHGTGGGAYDRVTEVWLRDWLGWTLAPVGVVTATLTLDLGVPEVTRADLRAARWRAHHARHNPGALGDAPALRLAADEKRALVGRIRESDAPDRAGLFAAMHALLSRVRAEHGGALAALDARAEEVAAALADRAIAGDRTWAWMLHSDRDLAGLRRAIDDAVRGGRS